MYVIVEIQGQQFKVENGKKLFVHYLGAEHGAVLEFDKVLLVDKDGAVTVGTPTVEGAKVVCEVVSNDGFGKKGLVKGERILVFKKKRRKGYRRLNGHRQYFTEVLVKEIVALTNDWVSKYSVDNMLRPVIFWFVREVLFIIPEKTWVLEKTIRCSHW